MGGRPCVRKRTAAACCVTLWHPPPPPPQIAYSLVFLIARGDMLGPDRPVVLHLLDVPGTEGKLEGILMELEDLASPVLIGTGVVRAGGVPGSC